MKGKYGHLDQIDVVESPLPTWLTGENGLIYDGELDMFSSLIGYEEGVIYIRSNPWVTNEFGNTLTDVIRHEFGHAWAWLDSDLFRKKWFKEAFGASYWNEQGPHSEYYDSISNLTYREFQSFDLSDEYITPYAVSAPYEDLAETFMTYLKCRGRIGKYRSRPGVYRKLRAIKEASRRLKEK